MDAPSSVEKSTAKGTVAPVPPFWQVHDTVEDYLTKCAHFTGWKVDTWQYGSAGTLNLYPFAVNRRAGLHLSYEDSTRRLRTSLSAVYPLNTWWSLVPSLRYRTATDTSSHKFRLEEGVNSVKYTFRNSAFYATARSFLFDKMYTEMSATTRLCDKAYLGACAAYDPTRSGLKDLTVMAVCEECPNFWKGDVALKYSARDGVSAQLRLPLHRLLDFAVIGEANRYIVGIHGRSPCGARMIVNGNVSEGSVTVSATRQIYDQWKFAASATVPVVRNGDKMRWGVQIVHQDVVVR